MSTPSTSEQAFEARVARHCARLREAGHVVERIDTHISTVLLAGDDAWKFKKPVDFGFVDFTSVARRCHFCRREVELNRRFAPDLYRGVDVLPGAAPGEQDECLVHMRRFDRAATLDRLLPAGRVDGTMIARFAQVLAAAHAAGAAADPVGAHGSPAVVSRQVLATLEAPLAAGLPPGLAAEVGARVAALDARFAARLAGGHVRDCHGDLHLSNVVWLDGELRAFDCIEFDDALRVIDTLADAAFLLMDLDHHGGGELANVFFNHYLEASGDIDGLDLLPLYLAYRSLIRAKVALLGEPRDDAVRVRAARHVELAARYLEPAGQPGLVITHGLSGSGKSRAARRLAEQRGFLQLRSDVERRRIAGLALDVDSASPAGAGLYTRAHSQATYAHLAACTRRALGAGFSVVVDAAFLERAQRRVFRDLAAALGVPFHVLTCAAPLDELRARIAARRIRGDDPSEATVEVLEHQREAIEPPDAGERSFCITPDALDLADGSTRLGRARPGCLSS
ncbi:MAG: AAA family ATPase [Gammaproteobacteria bacterium]